MICRQMIWLISHHYDTHLMTFRKMSNFRILFYNSPLFISDMVAEILASENLLKIFAQKSRNFLEKRKKTRLKRP